APHPQEVTVILGAWATHHVMPTRLLERFAISPERTPGRLHSLMQVGGVQESFILSTCNRVEYYVSLAATADPAAAATALVDLLVGAGRMSQRAGLRLREAGVSTIAVTSRTMAHAQALADQVGGITVALPYLRTAIASADVVVSCTGSPGYVVTADDVAGAAAWSSGRPMFMLDLAVPRDIDPVARDFPGVLVVDIEDIGHRLRASGGTDDLQAARS